MSWNGTPVIDLDSHIVERADRFYGDYLDPAYQEPYRQLCDAVKQQAETGNAYSLFGSRTSIVEPVEAGRPLGRRDTFGLTRRSGMEGGRRAFPPGRVEALPPIRPEVTAADLSVVKHRTLEHQMFQHAELAGGEFDIRNRAFAPLGGPLGIERAVRFLRNDQLGRHVLVAVTVAEVPLADGGGLRSGPTSKARRSNGATSTRQSRSRTFT